jgi:hypothetical protein
VISTFVIPLFIQSCLLTLCAGIAAVGYGSVLAWFLRSRPNLGDRGILGFLCFGFVGCILHFAVALSTVPQVIVLAVGATMAALLWRQVLQDASLSLIGAVGLSFFVLLHPQALSSPNYDNGLYHLQTFKWNREFPITVGLGNLHGRLAFNSILFLTAPLTDRIEIGWITNLLTFAFVTLSLFARHRRIEWSDSRGAMQYWFVTLTLAIFAVQPKYFLGILVADSVVTVLIVYWVSLALGLSRSGDRSTTFALLVASAVLATTEKISAAPLLFLTMALWWSYRKERFLRPKHVWTIAVLMLAVWMLRGVLLSGCAVYPVRQTCFSSLPWAVSLRQIDDENLYIQASARQPEETDIARVLRDRSWLLPWLDTAIKSRSMEFLLAGVMAGVLATAVAGTKIWAKPRDDLWLIAIGLAGCLVFWFLSAPAVRLGAGFILAAALFGLSLAGATFLHRACFYYYTPVALVLIIALSAIPGMEGVRIGGFFYDFPASEAYQLPTTQTVRLWVPRAGDQCWAHELPCTPYVNQAALARVRWPAVLCGDRNTDDTRLEPPPGWIPLSGIGPELSGRIADQRHPPFH